MSHALEYNIASDMGGGDYAGTLPQWHREPPNNSSIDAGKGKADTPADSLTQSLAEQ